MSCLDNRQTPDGVSCRMAALVDSRFLAASNFVVYLALFACDNRRDRAICLAYVYSFSIFNPQGQGGGRYDLCRGH